MYGVLEGRTLIAVHDDEEVVDEFVQQQSAKQLNIVKLKKSKSKEIKRSSKYQDLYLVRYGDMYVPYEYYDTVKELNGQAAYDIKYCRDVIMRLLEEHEFTDKEVKHMMKTVCILAEVSDDTVVDIETVRHMKEMNDQYRQTINGSL